MATRDRTAAPKARRRKGDGGNGNKPPRTPLTANERADLLKIASAIATRASITQRLGKQYDDDRALYDALGYTLDPTQNAYMGKYRRQDIAKAVIDAPVDESWREPPTLTESDKDDTPFVADWNRVVKEVRVYRDLSRVDRLCRINQYAVLLCGYDDKAELDQPVVRAKNLLYLQPYSQLNAAIDSLVGDPKDKRYGLPEMYSIKMRGTALDSTGMSKKVHWSRIIHVAEDLLESNTHGLPILESVFNRLDDLEKIVGGAGEMFWRGAFPGYQFTNRPDAVITQSEDDIEDEIEEYLHDLKRYLLLENMDIKSLAQQVADPKPTFDVIVTLIAAACRMPVRILLGSERGELASSQDERSWLKKIGSRRIRHCEPTLVRALADRLVLYGVIRKPMSDDYTVDWPSLMANTDSEKAEIGERKAKAIKAYVETPGAENIVPASMFRRDILGFTVEQNEEAERLIAGVMDDANMDDDDVDVDVDVDVDADDDDDIDTED